jgi:D-glycerate 3-kinase
VSLSDWLADFTAAERLPPAFADTVMATWVPVAHRIAQQARRSGRRPFVVGVCGAQGSGKSTACAVMARRLAEEGLRVAVLSIDDLYLTHAERGELAARAHPLFVTRGPPGTHDLALGHAVLDALGRSGLTALPRFDKAADTREPEEGWEVFDGPAEVVLFEGWCVGARPETSEALRAPVNDLERTQDSDGRWRTYVNDALASPYQQLFARLDRLILLKAPDFETVLLWRREQERKLRARLASSGSGPQRAMSDAQVETFVAHYERLTRFILREMPDRADEIVRLDAERRPINP